MLCLDPLRNIILHCNCKRWTTCTGEEYSRRSTAARHDSTCHRREGGPRTQDLGNAVIAATNSHTLSPLHDAGTYYCAPTGTQAFQASYHCGVSPPLLPPQSHCTALHCTTADRLLEWWQGMALTPHLLVIQTYLPPTMAIWIHCKVGPERAIHYVACPCGCTAASAFAAHALCPLPRVSRLSVKALAGRILLFSVIGVWEIDR